MEYAVHLQINDDEDRVFSRYRAVRRFVECRVTECVEKTLFRGDGHVDHFLVEMPVSAPAAQHTIGQLVLAVRRRSDRAHKITSNRQRCTATRAQPFPPPLII